MERRHPVLHVPRADGQPPLLHQVRHLVAWLYTVRDGGEEDSLRGKGHAPANHEGQEALACHCAAAEISCPVAECWWFTCRSCETRISPCPPTFPGSLPAWLGRCCARTQKCARLHHSCCSFPLYGFMLRGSWNSQSIPRLTSPWLPLSPHRWTLAQKGRFLDSPALLHPDIGNHLLFSSYLWPVTYP